MTLSLPSQSLRPGSSCIVTILLYLLLENGTRRFTTCHALASPKPPKSRGTKPGGGAGFGATVPTDYRIDTTSQPVTVAFFEFLKAQKGANVENVEIGYDKVTGRRGLYATKTFGKENAVICKVPSDCALALSDPAAAAAAQTADDIPNMAQRGLDFLNLYYYKQQDAWFKPYMDILPSSMLESTTPNVWSDEEIDLLEFPRIMAQAKERRQQIQQLALQSGVSLSDLQYATWLVTSRAFPLRLSADDAATATEYDDRGQVLATAAPSGKFIPVLVPLIDMANHHATTPNAKLTVMDPEKDEAFFALTTLRPIKAGKEITIAYGSGVDSSVELLLNYGFVAPKNPIDTFMLKKGGDDCLTNLDSWKTTLDQDRTALTMLQGDDERTETMHKILSFRIQLKESYSS